MEISLLTAFAVLPILAAAAAQKGYILPVCLTLVYTFLGFILLMVNMYLHPLSSMTAIVYAGYSGCRNYPATQYSGGIPLHRRVGRCFCPAGWGCFEKEKVRCI